MTDLISTFFAPAKNLKLTPKEHTCAQKAILCSMQEYPVRDGQFYRHKSPMKTTPETMLSPAENIFLTKGEKAAGLKNLQEVMQENPVQLKASSYEEEEESLIESIIQWWHMVVRVLAHKGLPTFIAIVFFMTSSGMVATVAEAALPGDILYPVKVNYTEPIVGTFAFTHKAKAEWESKRVERRLQEAEKLSALGRMSDEVSEELAASIALHSEQAEQHLIAFAATDPVEAAGVGAQIEGTLAAHETLLRTVGNGSTNAVLRAARTAKRNVRARTQHASAVPSQGAQELKERASSTIKGAIASLPRNAERPLRVRGSDRDKMHEEFAALQEEEEKLRPKPPTPPKKEPSPPVIKKPVKAVVKSPPPVSQPKAPPPAPPREKAAPRTAESVKEPVVLSSFSFEESSEEPEVMEAPIVVKEEAPEPRYEAPEVITEPVLVEEETPDPVVEEEPEVVEEESVSAEESDLSDDPATPDEEPSITEAAEELLQEAEESLQDAEAELIEGDDAAAADSAIEAERAAQEAQVLLTEQEEFLGEAKDALEVLEKAIKSIAEASELLASTSQTNANLLIALYDASDELEKMQKEANTFFEDGAYADVLKLSKKARLLAEEVYAKVEEAVEALSATEEDEVAVPEEE